MNVHTSPLYEKLAPIIPAPARATTPRRPAAARARRKHGHKRIEETDGADSLPRNDTNGHERVNNRGGTAPEGTRGAEGPARVPGDSKPYSHLYSLQDTVVDSGGRTGVGHTPATGQREVQSAAFMMQKTAARPRESRESSGKSLKSYSPEGYDSDDYLTAIPVIT